MAGTGVEPDLNAWGIDLCSAVTDMVRNNVEGCGLSFRLDVCPRVSVAIVGVGLLVATAWRPGSGLLVPWV